ncbi:MAG: proton-conducting transporter membrane subunit [Chlamydiota bacterium]
MSLFSPHPITSLLVGLLLYVGCIAGLFSWTYLQGDRRKARFVLELFLAIAALTSMIFANHLLVLYVSWVASNALLARMMTHHRGWSAARNGGALARKNFALGALFVGVALSLFWQQGGSPYVDTVLSAKSVQEGSSVTTFALTLLILGAMTQSALWPFHRWLISSLNSPTPVSAFMHAGFVNGGYFFLARFFPLYLAQPRLLFLLFSVGMISAFLGTSWQLLQNNVKGMLACSTMGQMGFMFAQCGMGLFPAALAHLVTHSLFKSYLFFASGGAARETCYEIQTDRPLSLLSLSLLYGAWGSLCFAFSSGKSWASQDTNLVLLVVVFLTASQCALPLLCAPIRYKKRIAACVVGALSLLYGAVVDFMTHRTPESMMQPQALNIGHGITILLMVGAWLFLTLWKFSFFQHTPRWLLRVYVLQKNASEPDPEATTPYRNDYQY